MIRLERTLQAWGTSDFERVFKQELALVGNHVLPLQQALSVGNHVTDASPTVIFISAQETEATLHLHAALVFTSIIAGCSCADDPTPLDENTEYCEVMLAVDRTTAITAISQPVESPD
ncbi:MAG: hypothetical protein WCT35_02280 [Sideroxydans sp.]